jgi:FtsP/CotA-like multicopper oxidase with cupredoxin domain
MISFRRVMTTLALLAAAATLSAQQPLPDPIFWTSADIRNKPLVIAPGTVTIGTQQMQSNLYNGMYTPPVFRLSPGESLDLTIVNQMVPDDSGGATTTPPAQRTDTSAPAATAPPAPAARAAVVQAVPGLFETIGMEKRATTAAIRHDMAAMMHVPDFYTNVHYHGFGVSPLGNSDNVYIVVKPGQTFQYHVVIPPDHPTGLYWYHPHPHQISEAQVLGGMSGAIIIDGMERQRPFLQGMRQRVMLLKHVQFPNSTTNTYSINGTVGSRIDIRPGEQQFWRIANVGADANFHLTLGGPKFLVVAIDGNLLETPTAMSDVFVPPGGRYEVVVTGPPAGSYPLKALSVEIIKGVNFPAETVMATLVSSGTVAASAKAAAQAMGSDNRPGVKEIRDAPVARRCTWTFTQTADASKFMINNQVYDMNRIDTQVKLGTYEEWTIVNNSIELHTFHIHQTDYLVTAIDGKPVTMNHTQDSLNLPFADASGPHSVTIKIPFVNPLMLGEFVFHCHVLAHEDRGMMANIVVSKDDAPPNPACR